MDLVELRRRVGAEVPAFVYTMPDFQNPSGSRAAWPSSRRSLPAMSVSP
jgi:DNA-binding transcriptional MocR family regulator